LINAKLTEKSPTGRILIGNVVVTLTGAFTQASIDSEKPEPAGLTPEQFAQFKAEFALEEIPAVNGNITVNTDGEKFKAEFALEEIPAPKPEAKKAEDKPKK
jgi:hypothetical protein